MVLPLEIIVFYGVAFIILAFLINRKTKLLHSVAISLSTVMVASEYWEVPIFVAGLLGVAYWWPYPSLSFVLHHLNIIMLFVWLIYIAKIKLREARSFWLVGLAFNTLVLLFYPVSAINIWYARVMGMFFFGLGVYFGSPLINRCVYIHKA